MKEECCGGEGLSKGWGEKGGDFGWGNGGGKEECGMQRDESIAVRIRWINTGGHGPRKKGMGSKFAAMGGMYGGEERYSGIQEALIKKRRSEVKNGT